MSTRVGFFDYPGQYLEHREEYIKAFDEVCSRGSYILGDDLEKFEKELATYLQAGNAVGTGNCTDGIYLSLYAAGVGAGDEVISVSNTFVATIEVIRQLGARPVLADIADDHNLDVDQVEALITPRTKAVVPVHLNGRVCDRMEVLVEIAMDRDLTIIEDAAQSIGARYRGECAGTFGLAGCFSFYPAKILGAFGDAGAVVTDDEDLAGRLKALRNHGRSERGEVEMWGFNSRMDNLQAAILNLKLARLDETIRRRREIAAIYDKGLSEIPGIKLPPPPSEDGDHFDVFQNYEIEVEQRDALMRHLYDRGIGTAMQWGGKGVHQFRQLGFSEISLPRTEAFFRSALLLPIYPNMVDDQVGHVVRSIREFASTC